MPMREWQAPGKTRDTVNPLQAALGNHYSSLELVQYLSTPAFNCYKTPTLKMMAKRVSLLRCSSRLPLITSSTSSLNRLSLLQSQLSRTLASESSGASANNTSALPTRKERPRRALFYVPGSDERKLNSSLKSKADCITYDLEDSVALNRKGQARQLVFNALETFNVGRSEKAVRINAVGSGLEIDDLNVVLRSPNLQAILVPKVQSARDVQFVTRMIDTIAPASNRENIRILAAIESALGIMNIKEIAQSDPRVDALIFAAEDYCADTGLLRSGTRLEMLYARQTVVTAAIAYGLQAIDLVCVEFQDENTLRAECDEGRAFGFTGKQAIHPKQVDVIQMLYMPAEKDVSRATKIVEGYHEHLKKGVGAFSLDGKMIDMPVVKWAERLLAKANIDKQ
ncbi:hypothetical protein SmJEL517_g01152 [Synchytrium microbalum]|uniref:HpcH/HpaI aldolase/citrate lyase domain-containing protein n=1 Tax=Synchytrium microbalum TaxID=1806994 RepID=A0A507CFB4_9FUNG|nr:uncharacterized protein SmJEL517_g01152 [Synchytrium microbalum]TPX36614.1 hypothetical protein SmJEL517_g01152 [Synchytrium microbalum]